MNKLPAAQIKTKHQHEAALNAAADAIRAEIHAFNVFLMEARERMERLTEQYNEEVEATNSFLESINEAQEAYIGERSEAWGDSDKGIMYRDWADEWQHTLEAFEDELPDEFEEPDFYDLKTLQSLPEAP